MRWLVLLALWSAPAGAMAEAPKAHRRALGAHVGEVDLFSLQVTGSRLILRVTVNGIPLPERQIAEANGVSVPLNPWMRPGDNAVSVQIVAEEGGGLRRLRVARAEAGADPADPLRTVHELPTDVPMPVSETLTVTVPRFPALTLWRTEALTFGESDRQAIVAELLRLHQGMKQAVQRCRPQKLLQAVHLANDDQERSLGAKASGASERLMRRLFRETLAEMGPEEVEFSPIPSMDLAFEIVGDGRLVKVRRADGQPVLMTKVGPLSVLLQEPILGKLDGQWTVVR